MKVLESLMDAQTAFRKLLKVPFYNNTTSNLEFPKGTNIPLVKSVVNADGSYSLQLANGGILQSIMPVFAWPGITIPNVPTLPGANTFEHGAVVRLHQDNFVGVGANPLGIEIQADAINNIWRPHGRQVIWSSFFGLIASPTVSLTEAGRFNIGTDPIVPAGLLNYVNANLVVSAYIKSTNTLATQGPSIAIYVGTDLSTYTNNPTILSNTANSADGATIPPKTRLITASATSALSTRFATFGGTGGNATTGLVDVSGGLLNFANPQRITAAVGNMGTATTVSMYNIEISWEY